MLIYHILYEKHLSVKTFTIKTGHIIIGRWWSSIGCSEFLRYKITDLFRCRPTLRAFFSLIRHKKLYGWNIPESVYIAVQPFRVYSSFQKNYCITIIYVTAKWERNGAVAVTGKSGHQSQRMTLSIYRTTLLPRSRLHCHAIHPKKEIHLLNIFNNSTSKNRGGICLIYNVIQIHFRVSFFISI